MAGFFKVEDTGGTVVAGAVCPCGLHRGCKTPMMKYSGRGALGILVIAEAPGQAEDEHSIQLIGKAGQLLRRYLNSLGVDLDRDCWKINAVNCRPPDNREPTPKELASCRARVWAAARELKPRKIIVLGAAAMKQILGMRIDFGGGTADEGERKKGKTGLEKWVGRAIPDRDWQAWIFPTWHPSYLLRSKGDVVLERMFLDHLERAVTWQRTFPAGTLDDEKKKIRFIQTVEAVAEYFRGFRFEDDIPEDGILPVALDIETTGLNPRLPGHRIYSMAFAESGESATAMTMFDAAFSEQMGGFISDNKIGKIAHNSAFEWTWLNQVGQILRPIVWDTMLAEHVLDNRPGVCGLKFQVYCRYGYAGYEAEMNAYLRAGADGINAIVQAPLKKLLTYNGLDALFTARLAGDQQREIKRAGLGEGYRLLHDGMLALTRASNIGIRVDLDWYEKQAAHLIRRIRAAKAAINETPGLPGNFDPLSNPQLAEMLAKIAPGRLGRQTVKGAVSVDDEALKGLEDIPLAAAVLDLRKLTKMKSTYIDGFIRNQTRGRLHPHFMLHTTVTYRSSSSDPNFQNIPARDKDAQRLTRKGIIPSKGNRLIEIDYSQIEVRVGACYHHDPVMIQYINDPTTDMHRDMACEVYQLEQEQVSKSVRSWVKNQFVFPEFYGDYWGQIAPHLWEIRQKEKLADGSPLWDHLKKTGLKDERRFTNHIEQVEKNFWEERFAVYNKWRVDTWEEYQEMGEIRLLTGLRCAGRMDRKQVANFPIQGAAFHCLLWSFTRLSQELVNRQMRTRLIAQIHDSLIADAPDDEVDEVIRLARRIMVEDIKAAFSWLIVPLEVEVEVSEVGGNWFEKRKYEL